VDLLLGHGPGLLSDSALTGQSAAALSAVGFALGWATSLTRFVLEVGLVGVGLYLWALSTAVEAVHKAWAQCRDDFSVSVTAAAGGAAAVYVAGALYHQPWTTDAIAIVFWCLLGIAVRWGRLRSAENESAAQADAAVDADVLVQPQDALEA
jgi:hypothetical protein